MYVYIYIYIYLFIYLFKIEPRFSLRLPFYIFSLLKKEIYVYRYIIEKLSMD